MTRKIFLLLAGLLFSALVIGLTSAADLEITKIDKGSVIISELDNPAIFEFIINNKGESDQFEIYSLVGVSMGPKGFFSLPQGESKLTVYAYPNSEIRSNPGFFNFEYQLKGSKTGIFKDNLMIKIVPLNEILKVDVSSISPEDTKANLTVKNKENTNIEGLTIKVSSLFFSDSKKISLKPYESISFELPLNKDEMQSLTAGMYVTNTEVQLEDKKTDIEGIVRYLEKQKIAVDESSSGWLVRTRTIKKTNAGSVPAKATIEIRKDIISRLFTVNSPEALAERKGFTVTYMWEKELAPGESFEVNSQSNYIFPLILIVLIVVAGLLAKVYSQNAIILNKRVSLVKTKGGEFALKVTIHAKARKFITNVQIIDTLPVVAKLYEKFGKLPDRVDNNGRRLVWNIERLNAGEERVYSYILYSKLKVVGRFELPAATALFEKDGKIQEVWSNRTFFATETSSARE